MRIRKLSVLFVMFCVSLPLCAFRSTSFFLNELSEGERLSVLSGAVAEAYTTEGSSTSAIMPYGTVIRNLAERTEGLDYAFSQALLSYVEYPQEFSSLSESEKLLKIFNISQSISTIKGITYLSHSSGYKPEVLFSESYLVQDGKKSKRIDDPVAETVPDKLEMYAYLKDSRFGGNIYRMNYLCTEDEIFLEITNVNAMKYMGIKCVKAENLHLYLDACLSGDGVIISGLAVVYNQKPVVNALVTKVDLPSAFLKRVNSLATWFRTRITDTDPDVTE